MTITTIYYDWFFTRDGKGYEKREVGKDGVIEIEEHTAKGEGVFFTLHSIKSKVLITP